MGNHLTLEQVCSLIADCEHKTAPAASVGDEFAYSVGTPDIQRGRLLLAQAKRVSRETYEAWTRRGAPSHGDLILAREAPVGQVGAVPERTRVCLGQRTVLLRPDPDVVEPRFLHYLLLGRDVQGWMADRAAGSTVPHLNVADVRKIPLGQLPDRSQQRAVAELLGSLDDKIEANRRTSILAEQLAVACVETAPAVVELETLAAIGRRMVAPASFVNDVVDHFSIPAHDSARLPVRERGATIKSGKFAIDSPTVLVSKLNPHIPRVWYAVPEPDIQAITSTEFICLEAIGEAGAEELWAACMSQRFFEQLRVQATGTTGSHQRVRPEDALSILVGDPRQLDDCIRTALRDAVRLAHVLRRESTRVADLRDTLLPKLVSGELRVRDDVAELETAP